MYEVIKKEAGRLGGLIWAETAKRQKQLRIEKYSANPSICAQCFAPLSYEKRKQTFCGRSCSTTQQNIAKSTIVEWTCKGCGKINNSLPHKVKKFCNHTCHRIVTKQDTWERSHSNAKF